MLRSVFILSALVALAACDNTAELKALRAQSAELEVRIQRDRELTKDQKAVAEEIADLKPKALVFLGAMPVGEPLDIVFPLQNLVDSAKVDFSPAADGTEFTFSAKASPMDAVKALEKVALAMPWLEAESFRFKPHEWSGKFKAFAPVMQTTPKAHPKPKQAAGPDDAPDAGSVEFPEESRLTRAELRQPLRERIASEQAEWDRLELAVAELPRQRGELMELRRFVGLRKSFDGIGAATAIVRAVNRLMSGSEDPWEVVLTPARVNVFGKEVPEAVETRMVSVLSAFGTVTDFGKGAGLDVVIKPPGAE